MIQLSDLSNPTDFSFEKKSFIQEPFETFNIERIDDPDFIRTYLTPTGSRYASVTSVLGLTKTGDFLDKWRKLIVFKRKIKPRLTLVLECSPFIPIGKLNQRIQSRKSFLPRIWNTLGQNMDT